MNRAERDRLSALLRAADPAAGVEGPPPAEAARLRRIVLAAAAESGPAAGREGGLRWAMAATLAAALVAVGAPLLHHREPPGGPESGRPVARARTGAAPGSPSSRGEEAPRASAAEIAAARPAAREAAAEDHPTRVAALPAPTVDASPASGGSAGGRRARRHAAPHDTAAERPLADPAAGEVLAALPAPLGRQIQVTAPGGTRIVWILTGSTGP